ncbi:MAG: hypothetical protein RSA29_02730 [Clostridium sp.]|uniref:hypothetical protein n=1 Tax=Clostridium sp. TaxID=1506 RepID=UPI00302A3D19
MSGVKQINMFDEIITEDHSVEIVKSKILDNFYTAFKDEKSIFSYKDYGSYVSILPHAKYFSSVGRFEIEKSKLNEFIDAVDLQGGNLRPSYIIRRTLL